MIVNATFPEQHERENFRELADKLSVPFTILVFHTRPEVLSRRIQKRVAIGEDASAADLTVLLGQIESYRPLAGKEMVETIIIDTEAEHPLDAIFCTRDQCDYF